MSRQPALTTPPAVIPIQDAKYITEVRIYKVITALYGGGVEPAQADPITVVRATEIRGHLRFWWRACRAAGYPDVQTLKKREGEIWGSTEQPSQVMVYCDIVNSDSIQQEIAYTVVRNEKNGKPKLQESSKLPKYATFPLQPDKTKINQIGWKSDPVLLNVNFKLQLIYPKTMEADIKAALWAWETFGGIGARTRRGFGALQWINSAESTPLTAEEVKQWIQKHLKNPEYVATGEGNPAVPKLNPAMTIKVIANTASVESSWRYLIDKLNQFRQARFGRQYGLSQWPEANAIRKLNGQGIKSAKTLSGPSPTPVNVSKYPRAAFGLPIIFHLPHDRLDDHSLEAVGHDRLASPLILRPLVFQSEQSGKAVSLIVGLAAILDAPRIPSGGLELKGKTKTPVLSDLSSAETKQILPLKGNSDVLQAFLNTL